MYIYIDTDLIYIYIIRYTYLQICIYIYIHGFQSSLFFTHTFVSKNGFNPQEGQIRFALKSSKVQLPDAGLSWETSSWMNWRRVVLGNMWRNSVVFFFKGGNPGSEVG